MEAKGEELVKALHKGEMETVQNLINEGVLEQYYLGIHSRQEYKMMEKIIRKVLRVRQMLELGIVVIPSVEHLRDHPLDRKLFNVTLIPGTDLVITLSVDMKGVKNATLTKKGVIPSHIICSLPEAPLEIVKLFLDFGTLNIDIHDENDITPLMIAVEQGNMDVVKYLVENGAAINKPATRTLYSNMGTLYDYSKIFIRKIIEIATIKIYFTPIVAAVYGDQPDVLRYLIKSGADVEKTGWVSLFRAVYTGNTEIVEILLKNGIGVNTKGLFGTRALHLVAEKGNVEMAELLLWHGADANATDDFGWTPLGVAALFSRNAPKAMIELLLDSGCDVNALNAGGFSPLNLVEAGSNLSFVKYLIRNLDTLKSSKHKGLEEHDSDIAHADIISLLLSRGADLNHRDDVLGWTTLHWAAACGDLRVARMLVEEHGAEMITKSKMDMTPFRTAKLFERKRVEEYLNPGKNLVE